MPKKRFPIFSWNPQWTPPDPDRFQIIATTLLGRQLCGGRLIGESQERPDQAAYDLEFKQPPADYDRQALFAWIGEQILTGMAIDIEFTGVVELIDPEDPWDLDILHDDTLDPDNLNPFALYWRLRVPQNMAGNCAPCPAQNITYDADGHKFVDGQNDDGSDIRFTDGTVPHLTGASGDCLSASGVSRALAEYRDTAAAQLEQGKTFLTIAAVLLGFIAVLLTEGAALPLVASAVLAIQGLSVAAFTAAVGPDEIDAFMCEIMCLFRANGDPWHLTTSDYDTLLAWIDDHYSGNEVARLFIRSFVMAAGIAGMNNAGAVNYDPDEICGDCDECPEPWVQDFDFRVSDGGWTAWVVNPSFPELAEWVDTVGWRSVDNGECTNPSFDAEQVAIHYPFNVDLTSLTFMVVYYTTPTGITSHSMAFTIDDVAGASQEPGEGTDLAFNTETPGGFGAAVSPGVYLAFCGNPGERGIISRIMYQGMGVNPF